MLKSEGVSKLADRLTNGQLNWGYVNFIKPGLTYDIYFFFYFAYISTSILVFFTTPWSVSTQVDSIFANFLEQKKTFYMRKDFNSHRTCLEHEGRGRHLFPSAKLT